MCAHTDKGTVGVVVTRPLSPPRLAILLKRPAFAPAPPARDIRLCDGGPADKGRGFVLHTNDWTGEGSLRVDDKFALTASLDVLKAIAEGGGPSQCVLALGYAGWGPGQLDPEIQKNTWLSAPPDETLLFDPSNEGKWQRAMGKLGVDPRLLSGVAGHA